MPKSKPVHYVDNEKFLKDMVIYKDQFNQAKKDGSPPPQISEYLGECFMKIAQRLSYRPNFINYAFRDDMISDGIENCIQYLNNLWTTCKDANENDTKTFDTEICPEIIRNDTNYAFVSVNTCEAEDCLDILLVDISKKGTNKKVK